MLDINAQRYMAADTVAYWRVNYSIQFRLYHPHVLNTEAWHRRIINQGYKELALVGFGTPDTALDSKGNALNAPVKLNENGTRATIGGPYHWLKFQTKPLATFATLGLE